MTSREPNIGDRINEAVRLSFVSFDPSSRPSRHVIASQAWPERNEMQRASPHASGTLILPPSPQVGKFFQITERNTTFLSELRAGLVCFLTGTAYTGTYSNVYCLAFFFFHHQSGFSPSPSFCSLLHHPGQCRHPRRYWGSLRLEDRVHQGQALPRIRLRLRRLRHKPRLVRLGREWEVMLLDTRHAGAYPSYPSYPAYSLFFFSPGLGSSYRGF